MVPFIIGCVVTYAKFGIPVGLPMADQVWATVNAHRRYFLAANGGKAFSFGFLPSTLTAYFQPVGIRLGGHLPLRRCRPVLPPHGSPVRCSTRPTPPPASRTPAHSSSSSGVGVR